MIISPYTMWHPVLKQGNIFDRYSDATDDESYSMNPEEVQRTVL